MKTKALTLTLPLGMLLMTASIALSPMPAQAHPTIDIVSSNWKYTPAKISIPVGEATTLRLTSSAGVHGLQSDALGIKQTVITPGKFVEVTFTPQKAGKYVLHCSIQCGPGHADMVLTIEVTDK